MTPFVVSAGAIIPEDVALFEKMCQTVRNLKEPERFVLSCHHVCHALAQYFPVEVVDGFFGKGCNHSWLVIRRDAITEGDQIIADMYPVAALSPQLLHAYWSTPWPKLYIANRAEIAHVLEAPAFTRELAAISAQMKTLLS